MRPVAAVRAVRRVLWAGQACAARIRVQGYRGRSLEACAQNWWASSWFWPARAFCSSCHHGCVPCAGGNQHVWRPAAPLASAGLSPAALVALQTREISPNDYDLLLLLDQRPERRPRPPPVQAVAASPSLTLGRYLAESLAVLTAPPETSACAHCGRLLDSSPPFPPGDDGAADAGSRRRNRPRKLPCGHTVHVEVSAAAGEIHASSTASSVRHLHVAHVEYFLLRDCRAVCRRSRW